MKEFNKFRISTKQNVYSDISTMFSNHPETKQLTRLVDVAAVKRSIRNLLFTEKYERPFSDMGSGIRTLLFENNNPQTTASTLEIKIRDVIENHERRCKLIDVIVENLDDNTLMVSIIFNIINISEEQSLQLRLDRRR